MEKIPEDLESIGVIMSNFDGKIEPDAEDNLKSKKVYGKYPARNFFAEVWFDGEKFKAVIMQYKVHVSTLTGDSLQDIMNQASTLYGWM